MFRLFFISPLLFFVLLTCVIVALTFHEWGHAYMAYRLGDPTAKYMGRLTLNPLKHLDPIGTLCMIFAGMGFAKPVPIDPRYFRNPRRDDFLVSIAGITMNLILFILASATLFAIYRWGYGISAVRIVQFMRQHWLPPEVSHGIVSFVLMTLYIFSVLNLGLMAFNLLPVPPLDGYHVLNDLILKRSLFASAQTMRVGIVVLVVLVFTGMLNNYFSFVRATMFGGMAFLFSL